MTRTHLKIEFSVLSVIPAEAGIQCINRFWIPDQVGNDMVGNFEMGSRIISLTPAKGKISLEHPEKVVEHIGEE